MDALDDTAERALKAAHAAPRETRHRLANATYDALLPAVEVLLDKGYSVTGACAFLRDQKVWTFDGPGGPSFSAFCRAMQHRIRKRKN